MATMIVSKVINPTEYKKRQRSAVFGVNAPVTPASLFNLTKATIDARFDNGDIEGLMVYAGLDPWDTFFPNISAHLVEYAYGAMSILLDNMVTSEIEIIETLAEVAPVVQTAMPLPKAPVPAREVNPIGKGFYTIEFENGEYVTLRISEDFRDNAKPGAMMAGYLSGSNNTSDYTGFAFIDPMRNVRTWSRFSGKLPQQHAALNILLGAEDVNDYGKAYARQSGNCYVCNKVLTTPQSIEAGIGPICADRLA